MDRRSSDLPLLLAARIVLQLMFSFPVHPPKTRGRVMAVIRIGWWVTIVLALLAVWKAVGNPFYREPASHRHRTAAYLSNVRSALEAFNLDYGRYPTTAEGLQVLVAPPPDADGSSHPYLEEMRVDEWGSALWYSFPSADDPERYDLHSVGRDKVDGTADDVGP